MTSPRFAYAQARLQARHAERLAPSAWVRLETSQSAQHFLQAVRDTPLGRWVGALDRDSDARAVEAALQLSFHEHVDEVADWIEDPWAPSVRWMRWFPLLQRCAAQPADEQVARWAAEGDGESLLDADAGRTWLSHFRSLCPRFGVQGIEALVERVQRHLAKMAEARPEEKSAALRAEIGRDLERRFRQQPATPVAVFSHLGLTLLELERLRGALVVRLLLSNTSNAAGGAWA